MLFAALFLARAMDHGVQCIKTFANKKARPDVDVSVTRGIVQVPVGQARIGPIVPPTAKHGDHRAPHGPKLI